MSPHRIRRTAAALALAAILILGAPAHAAGWNSWTTPHSWLGNALEWLARLWAGGGSSLSPEPARMKSDQGNGIDPDGSAPRPTPPSVAGSEADKGAGIDPDG